MPEFDIDSNEKHQQYKRLVRIRDPGPVARHASAQGQAARRDTTGSATGRYRHRVTRRLIAALIGLFATCAIQATPPTPGLSADSEIATAGFFRLHWESADGPFELQEAADPGFHNATTLYRGPDLAAVISGKPDGTWYYRVRTSLENRNGPWSKPVTVTVSHHDLSRALLFLLLGLLVFVAITLLIIRGEETG